MKITTNVKESGMAEILVNFDWADVAAQKDSVLKEIQKDFEMDGFRKGNAPMEMVEKNTDPIHVYEMGVENLLQQKYVDILKESGIDAIGRPMVTILKIAEGNPVEIKIETALYPTVALGDYKKIAKEAGAEIAKEAGVFEATDEELSKTFEELQQMRAHQKLHSEGGHDHDDHSHGEITPDMYPTLDDEFAKTFGFDDLEKMREKVRENLAKEKEQKHSEKSRIAMIEKLIEATPIVIPQLLIDTELDSMMNRMQHDIGMMGMQFNDYLKHINKTEADLRNDYTNDAKKRVASKLVIEEIAKKESIKPDEAAVETEVTKLLEQYPDADRVQTTMYVESVLTNEQVFKFSENK